MAARLAAVTGATGFLGRHLVRHLVAEGWRVRVLARRDLAHPLWRDLEVEAVIGDLSDPGALAGLCAGADLVVHGAGLIKARSREAFAAVNVEGTRRVAQNTPGAMLLVSSLAAREPQLSDYAWSKRAGEDAAREVLGGRLGVARPPALYGPGDVETLPLFQLAAASPVLPVLDPAARLSLMHVDDAARQIAALAQARPGFAVALSDARPEGYGWREIMQTAAGVFGRRPALVRLPGGVLQTLAALGRFAPSGAAPMITPGKVREILHSDWAVRPAEQTVKLPPPLFDLAKGFLNTVLAYTNDGLRFRGFARSARPTRRNATNMRR